MGNSNQKGLAKDNRKVSKYYKMGQNIGEQGAFGYAVRAVTKATKEEVAIKVIDKKNLALDDLKAEIELLTTLDHPNIIKGRDVFEDKKKVYLVMDICTGGELFDRIVEETKKNRVSGVSRGYCEQDAANILRQLFSGLEYMHGRNIAHCDLKPSNFLFLDETQDSLLKIIDFGMSKFTTSDEKLSAIQGTTEYMAPEVLQGQYTFHCDMWSMGVVMFVMMFGFPPFRSTPPEAKEHDDRYRGYSPLCTCSECQVMTAIKNGFDPVVKPGYGAHFPANMPVSSQAYDLLTKLFQRDVSLRATASEALAHPWMNGEASTTPFLGAMLENLEQLTAASKLKHAVLSALSSDIFSDVEIQMLHQAFRELDVDGDGAVTMNELKELMEKSSDNPQLVSQIQTLMSLGDLDGDGKLDFNEMLLAATQRKLIAKEERLTSIFQQLDENNDGKITAAEIHNVLNIPEADIAEMIAEVDTDNNGYLDYDEFVDVFMKRDVALPPPS